MTLALFSAAPRGYDSAGFRPTSPTSGRQPGREHHLDIRQLRSLRGWDRAFGILLLIAIPVAIFHIASGRIGNGLIAIGAAIIGAVILLSDIYLRHDERLDSSDDAYDDEYDGWDDDEAVDWLDRPTDAPLPAPFQAFLDELARNGVPSDDDSRHAHDPR